MAMQVKEGKTSEAMMQGASFLQIIDYSGKSQLKPFQKVQVLINMPFQKGQCFGQDAVSEGAIFDQHSVPEGTVMWSRRGDF